MRLLELISEPQKQKMLVIFPGGFHIFHAGHKSVYDFLKDKFPTADVFIAASNAQTERPFSFNQKQFLASQAGVDPVHFVQVKNPYKAEEITSKYDPDETVLVFAVSSKDGARFAGGKKKDGSMMYLQPWNDNEKHEPMDKHAYYFIAPVQQFWVLGQNRSSASDIRRLYAESKPAEREKIIADLYPKAWSPKKIAKVLNSVLGVKE